MFSGGGEGSDYFVVYFLEVWLSFCLGVVGMISEEGGLGCVLIGLFTWCSGRGGWGRMRRKRGISVHHEDDNVLQYICIFISVCSFSNHTGSGGFVSSYRHKGEILFQWPIADVCQKQIKK